MLTAYNFQIRKSELTRVTPKVEQQVSHGHDCIGDEILKCSTKVKTYLAVTFSRAPKESKFLTTCKIAIPLPLFNKGYRVKLENYRPNNYRVSFVKYLNNFCINE